jgi:peroxiredoxin
MAYTFSEGYPQQTYYSEDASIIHGYHMEQIEEYDDENRFVPPGMLILQLAVPGFFTPSTGHVPGYCSQ